MTTYDIIVIGGGHNGLVNSAYLAKAGKKVLVLERRHVLGGAACTEEIVPGFKNVREKGLQLIDASELHHLQPAVSASGVGVD